MIPGADQDKTGSWIKDNGREFVPTTTAPATPAAQQWAGWGTALKPAFEPLVVARKPLVGTVVANTLAHGVGGLNIDGCRIETEDNLGGGAYAKVGNRSESSSLHGGSGMNVPGKTVGKEFVAPSGRWPANVVLDEHTADLLDAQSGTLTSGKMAPTRPKGSRGVYGQDAASGYETKETYGDTGGASRFFYQAKAGKAERPKVDGQSHPTIKPLALMRWLVRLVTPPGGYVLEPFAGSGTTIQAALTEGFKCIAFESEAAYIPHIRARLADAMLLPAPEDEETEEVSR
jgi:site-specific DNA-methyltransferase (adenine-specific)